jgi:subtilisin family serine protease
MRSKRLAAAVLAVYVGMTVTPASAGPGDSMVRVKDGYNGNVVVNLLCNALLCDVLGALDVLPGEDEGGKLFLVRNLPVVTWLVNLLLNTLGIASVEADLPVAISDGNVFRSDQASASVLDELWRGDAKSYYGTPSLQSYLEQPAGEIVAVRHTHCGLRATGGGVVAVIDTGVDTQHPTLAPHLVPGFDFTRNQPGGNERADVDQASASVLDEVYPVNASTMAGVDQASASVLDDPSRRAFGHGTMVAGVIHLVAPTARIMPLKAFDASGAGYTSSIVRALYYASLKDASVINMSFSRPTPSYELKRALDFAAWRGSVLVAAAGNVGTTALRYPAAYSNVIGVASTRNDDTRSSFSSYGSGLVSLAAPGEAIITTYPFDTFAAAWGTSFAAPFVSGAAALVEGIRPSASPSQVGSVLSNARYIGSSMGAGRLDLEEAIQAARDQWPSGAQSPVPESCYQGGIDWTEIQ